MQKFTDEYKIVEAAIQKVGKTIVLGTPLGAGKSNHIINAFYQKALADPSIDLTICTGLTLQRPKGGSDLEQRFINLFEQRIFGDYPDLDYELARTTHSLPENVKVIEFYFPPGKFIHNNKAQQQYISSNYTHVVRDMVDRKINVLTQLVAHQTNNGASLFSLSCNPDVTIDMAELLKDCGYPVAMIAQVNQNLPFMYGEAVVQENFFEFVLDDPGKYFKIFGPPKMSVSDADYMIGLYCSTLVKDDGELQIGIGSLGDSTVYNLLLRHQQNDVYQQILKDLKINERFANETQLLGDTSPFQDGLFGATEMLVDGFMHLYKAGIIKKKVYDNIQLQNLINADLIEADFKDNILEVLFNNRVIRNRLTEEDFNFLQEWGILKDNLTFENDLICIDDKEKFRPILDDAASLNMLKTKCLGTSLKKGQMMHGGFFLGPQEFYQWLRDLPEDEKQLINMKSVQKINQLYGHEMINRLHRKNARFINSCMMQTLSGAAVSDGLENGKVVSGVGGQYNFVAMAQELPDGNSILNLRSTRFEKGKLKSNIVPFYGHITIPRHLRDIVVTEYGIAFIRGKTDAEIIKALLNITDSQFQEELLTWAKSMGKIEADYQIPEMHKNNTPATYAAVLRKLKEKSYYPPFPFGTDLTKKEIKVGKALKALKKDLGSKPDLIKTIMKGLFLTPKPQDIELLESMQLLKPKNVKERLYQKLLLAKFRALGY
ncbi:MAG: acetyl-CoA hydrolase/transferase C-terminal domain-containing protein [Chitinophagales bacterium]